MNDESAVSTCVAEQEALKALQEKADAQGKKLEEEGKDLQEGSDFSIDFEVEWETVDIKFGVPHVTWTDSEIKFHAPKMYKKKVDVSFDVPELRWEQTTIGWYIKCHKLKCRKEPIKSKVPKWYHKTVDISFDVPDFEWGETSIDFNYPEFDMRELHWKFDVPRFRLKSIEIGGKVVYDKEMDEKGKELSRRAEELAAGLQQEFAEAAASLNECFVNHLLQRRDEVDEQFQSGIKLLEAAREAMSAQGATAGSVKDASGNVVNLDEELKRLRKQHEEALAAIDEQVKDLTEAAGSKVEAALTATVPAMF